MPRILMSGASGLIGSALVSSLESHGYGVFRLVRREAQKSNEVHWDPMRPISSDVVSGYDAIIHLSGESITGRWTAAKKTRIHDSRVISTRNLSEALAKCQGLPRTFLCASATGYYGSRGDDVLTEEGSPGVGFLPDVCKEWESATDPAASAGIRTVNLRTGLVLSKHGGPLKPMLMPFRLGLGGKIGSGHQWWSWIHIEDWIAAAHHILQNESVHGPVNMVSPNPVTNADFTKTLASVLKRPAIFPVPAFAARLALGKLADEAVLASARVEPSKLRESGFQFKSPDLRSTLENLLRR